MTPVPAPAGDAIDWPAWIESISTMLAFYAVAATLNLQLRDRRAEHARQIDYHVWAERKTVAYSTEIIPQQPIEKQPPLGLQPEDYGHIWVTIRNNSSNPLNEVILRMPWGVQRCKLIGKIPPGEYTLLYKELSGREWAGDSLETLVSSIQFRDEAGRIWQRTANGSLRRIGRHRHRKYLMSV